MQITSETVKQVAACISGLTSLALVLRGWHHRRRYRRAVHAQRMRKYAKRAPRAVEQYELIPPPSAGVGVECGPSEELKGGRLRTGMKV